jgi:type IV pilus assembly protein PilY1
MSRITQLLRHGLAHPIARWIALPVLCAAGLAAVVAQPAVVLPPTISLSPEPLYARGARAKPTLTLALSVEFPTVGAQYVNKPNDKDDPSYSSSIKYVGYFDTESCYEYNRSEGNASLRYFYRTGAATDRTCGGTGFSGNFMNWATGSAIDVLRLGLTGGDRVVDTASLTVLQRAVLPNTSYTNNFWNGSNFPSKQLTAAQAAGAVPSSLLPSGFTGTLYVANCLNRMHFGTAKTGSCTAPGNNGNLGLDDPASAEKGLISNTTPSTWTFRSNEVYPGPGPNIVVTEKTQVAYGANSSWAYITVAAGGSYNCSNSAWATYAIPGLAASGDPISGTAKTCRSRTAPTTTTVGLTPDSFFYTRVRVCESDNSGALTDPRTNLCLRYPNGNYKPVGNLQKYSDRVRVAAFGYLNDNTANPQRSGGVLRAPMKYVGSRSFDANFQLISGTNTAQEWNESTGVLNTNPDGASTPNSGTGSNSPGNPISGVINYLNQFGRTGTFGQYKTYDPVGELYYESLRYLQGLQPSAVGTSIATNVTYNITDAMRDGFPVYTTYTDPHPAVSGMTDYSCVKNNIVGIGDVNTWNDKNFPGNNGTGKGDVALAADDTKNEPDFVFWTRIVGDFEAKRATTYADGKGVSRTTSNPNTALSTRNLETTITGAEGATFYMAGAAYWANTHDIRGTQWTDTAKRRPGMRVTTYWLDVNEYGQQTAAATHRNNQFYLTAKYGGFKDVTTSGNPYLKLQANKVPADNLFENDPDNLNWQRQTTDTNLKEAKNYFLSSSAQTVLDALDEIFATVASEANSIAGGAISTTRITAAGGLVYQAQFDPADWSGDVIAYPVALNASANALNIDGAASSPWRNAASQPVGASGKLDDMAAADRNIYVGSNTTDATPVFESSVFTWAAAASSVKTALYNSATEAASVGEDRLNFLRGDRTNEAGNSGGTFRKRSSKLGDIVNSGIAYVAAPTQRISDDSYASFRTANLNRTKTLYVGANDGMLHAFNAETGAELFAYIPSFVVPNLKALTSTTYAHQSYVDGTPVAAEANLGTSSSADWRTVLVSGAGGGGQGVFALDVTNPTAFNSGNGNSKILWEFTDKHDVDMGNVIGRPQIVKINVDAGSATPNYQYFAVVASGVNSQAADGNASTTGEPALFFLRLNKAKNAAWALGTNYYKVKLPVNDTSIASGIANFVTRTGFANELSFIYAGDLQGNLWKLDFRTASASTWDLNALSFYKNGSTAIPMFVAKDGTVAQNRQPITMEPTLTFGPNRSIIVSFGTGQYLSVADNSGPFKAQSVYALYDNNSNVADTSSSPAAAIAGRGRLQAGTTTASTIEVGVFVWGRPTSDASAASRSGWYFDFYNSATTNASAGTGERQISGSEVLAGKMIFGTVIPALNSCDNGTGNLYIVDLQSGDGTATVSTVGILGEPFVATLGSSAITVSNSTGVRKETARNQIITQGSGGLGTQPSVSTSQTVGRISWREISNYQDLRNAP